MQPLVLPHASGNAPFLRAARRLAEIFQFASDDAVQNIALWLSRGPVRSGDCGPFSQLELCHELSDYMECANTDVFHDGRSITEFGALAGSQMPTIQSVETFAEFCAALAYIKRATSPPPSSLRVSRVGTKPDKNGSYVVYPDWRCIVPQLEVIFEHWKRYHISEPGFAAIVVMVALVNLHPFVDGNGRTARVVFNWTLNLARLKPVYLPIYELSALSRCGYLLRLRQAQYHSEWGPLYEFLLLCSERTLGADSARFPAG